MSHPEERPSFLGQQRERGLEKLFVAKYFCIELKILLHFMNRFLRVFELVNEINISILSNFVYHNVTRMYI